MRNMKKKAGLHAAAMHFMSSSCSATYSGACEEADSLANNCTVQLAATIRIEYNRRLWQFQIQCCDVT